MSRYVVAPGLRVVPGDDAVVLEAPAHGTRAELSPDFLEIVEFFAAPRSLEELTARYDVDADVIDLLARNFFVVREDERDMLAAGFVARREIAVGEPCAWADLPARGGPGAWVAFGAPVDVAAGGDGGTRHGPTEIARSLPHWLRPGEFADRGDVVHVELRRRYDVAGLRVLDVGDAHHEPGEPYETFGRRVTKVVDDAAAQGMRPLMFGGDHSVSWFALRALLARHPRLGVLHFDAHHDLYPSVRGDLRHFNPFVFVAEQASLAVLLQIGLRTIDARPRDAVDVHDDRIRFVTAREAATRAPADVYAGLPTDIPYYLSFDVDCMDPTVAPETGTLVLGGLGYHTALDYVDEAARRFQLVGADFVEVSRSKTRINMAAHVAGAMVSAVVLGDVPHRPLDTYFFKRPG